MKLRMLGTGYGERKVKKFTSKDYRHSGGVLVDSEILLDAPADIFDSADELGFSDMFDELKAVFISHSHKGHFDAEAILRLAKKKTISVFAHREVLALIPDSERVIKNEVVPYRAIEFGAYRVLPLPCNHRTDNSREAALNYIISRDKNLLYMLDGGFLHNDVFRIISEIKLDAVIMDCALELSPPTAALMSHGSFDSCRLIRGIILTTPQTDERCRFILTHIPSLKKRSVHDELSAAAREAGFSVAYDGYFVNI